jgi:hypothetical protein
MVFWFVDLSLHFDLYLLNKSACLFKIWFDKRLLEGLPILWVNELSIGENSFILVIHSIIVNLFLVKFAQNGMTDSFEFLSIINKRPWLNQNFAMVTGSFCSFRNNEVWTSCKGHCDSYCGDPEPKYCTLECVPGCICRNGYARDENRRCIPKHKCPKPGN